MKIRQIIFMTLFFSVCKYTTAVSLHNYISIMPSPYLRTTYPFKLLFYTSCSTSEESRKKQFIFQMRYLLFWDVMQHRLVVSC